MSGTITKNTLLSTTTGTGPYTTVAFTPTAGTVLAFFGYVAGTVEAAPTAAGSANGLTFTRIAADPHTLAANETFLFLSTIVPGSPVSMTVTITLPTDPATSIICWVAEVTGCLAGGSAAIRSPGGTPQVGKALNLAANVAWDVSLPAAPLATNPILAFIGHAGGAVATAPGVTPPTGFTEVEEPADQTAGVIGAEFAKADSGISSAGPHSFTSSVARTRANIYLVEFDTTAGSAAASLILLSSARRLQPLLVR